MRYRLRTLLILLAVVPPVLSLYVANYLAWRAEREQMRAQREWLERVSVLPPPRVPLRPPGPTTDNRP
jgi:hypothetical protein